MKKALSVLLATSIVAALSAPSYAQERSRADVKAEVRAAGIDGSRTADLPTPTGPVVGGAPRSAVKAAAASVAGWEPADLPTPNVKIVNGQTRQAVRSEIPRVLTSGTADLPTPGPVKPSLFRRRSA